MLLAVATFSQSNSDPFKEKTTGKGVIYNTEMVANIGKQTRGFFIGGAYGKIKTYYLTRYFAFSLGELKHHKEYKTNLDNIGTSFYNTRPVIIGKQNNLYNLRLCIGEKRYFSEKDNYKGVAVGIDYNFGFNLGMLKPYYITLNHEGGVSGTDVKYSEEIEEYFLNPQSIIGAARWTKGFSELSVIPGLTLKTAVHIDWGAYDEFVKAMEAGIMVDYFFKQAPVMVEQEGSENKAFFVNLFLNLQLGKRK